jgi:uncharacterized SAM-binding protein YcdF (DUF218 family)
MIKRVIICLGSSLLKEKTIENMALRTEKSIELYNEERVSKIIFTGGFNTRKDISEAQYMANIAIKKGVDKNDIVLEEKSSTTIGNAYYSQIIMDNSEFNSAIIVTSPYHIRRVKYIFKKIMNNKQLRFEKHKNNFNFLESFSYLIKEFKIFLILIFLYKANTKKWVELEFCKQKEKTN